MPSTSQDHTFPMTEPRKNFNLQNAIFFQPLGNSDTTAGREEVLTVESVPRDSGSTSALETRSEKTQFHGSKHSSEVKISTFGISHQQLSDIIQPRSAAEEQYIVEPQPNFREQALMPENSHGMLDRERPLSDIRSISPGIRNSGARSLKNGESSRQHNPLQKYSMANALRRKLTDLLVHPVTEPLILLLLVAQAVLMAVYTSSNVSTHPLQQKNTRIDYSILGIFVIYTLEIAARIYVSGFVFARKQSEIPETQRNVGKFWSKRKKSFFGPSLLPSVDYETAIGGTGETNQLLLDSDLSSIDESFEKLPQTMEENMRLRLYRTAFLRHSFNRVDFLSVVSFWIAFALRHSGSGFPDTWRVLWMLSSARILRLLALTNGTAINLWNLKRVAPLLFNISLLIGFFMVIFAAIGVQFFHSSLKRECVLIDTRGMHSNYTSGQHCGGYLDHSNRKQPWLMANGENGTSKAFGYICSAGLVCLEGQNPYNGTMSFDDLPHALEQVFVLMTTNTFPDVMYELTMSNSLAAAIYFVAGIIILWFSLANQFTAVIIYAFGLVGYDESKRVALPALDSDSQESQPPLFHRTGFKHRLYCRTSWVWLVIIAYGLVSKCLRTSNMASSTRRFIDISETVVTAILFFEILVRISVLNRDFFRRARNNLDLLLATITVTMQIPKIRNSGEPYAWLTIFQILRIYCLALAIPLMRNFIPITLFDMSALGNIFLFTFILTFICALMASQLFRGSIPDFNDHLEVIDIKFSAIYNSFFGIFPFISGKDWTNVLYNVTASQTDGTAWVGAILFILWAAIMFFFVRNMLIACIQEGIELPEEEKHLLQVRKYLNQRSHPKQRKVTIFSLLRSFTKAPSRDDTIELGFVPNIYIPVPPEDQDSYDILGSAIADTSLDPKQTQFANSQRNSLVETPTSLKSIRSYLALFIGWGKDPFHSPLVLAPDTNLRLAIQQRNKERAGFLDKYPFVNRSLFVFAPHNCIRRFCQRIVAPSSNERFQGINPSIRVYISFWILIFVSICTMVITTCIATPLYQKEYFERHGFNFGAWFVVLDIVYPFLFTIESIIKVIADGFYLTPNAYVRAPWGFIQCVVLVTLWINLVATLHYEDSVPRAFGAIKALRAIRLLEAIEDFGPALYSTLVGGKWRLISAMLFCIAFMVAFALYALNLFTGQVMYCNDASSVIIRLTDCAGEFINDSFGFDVLSPRVVANPYYNFDTFGNSLFTVFPLASLESWVDLMWDSMNISGPNLEPKHLASQWHAIFFLIFNIACLVFIVSLFQAVVIRNYTESTGVAYLTSEQRSWLELKKLVLETSDLRQNSSSQRLEKRSKWRRWCYQQSSVETAGIWYWIMLTALLFHLILLSSGFYPSHTTWDRTRICIFLVLIFIYIANIIIRITGLTWREFSRGAWDIYSLFSILGTTITTGFVFADYHQERLSSTISAQAQGLFLVSMALTLIPMLKRLEKTFEAALTSFKSILKFLVAWLVLFIIFAIATTQCFSLTKFNRNENSNVNFRDVPRAFVLLFRMSFGKGWNRIMEDFATMNPPNCLDDRSARFLDGDCGSSGWARGLFITWNIINKYLIINLVVAVVCNSLSEIFFRSTGRSVINPDELRRVRETWAKHDPQLTGYIRKEGISQFLGGLTGGFAVKIYDSDFTVTRIIEDCQVASDERFHQALSSNKSFMNKIVELDLDLLNQRVSDISIQGIKERRLQLNIVFEEIMQMLDSNHSIHIKDLLMILVYHKFSTSKSLGFAESLQRKSHLQKVETILRHKMALGLFSQLYWKRHLRRELTARHKTRKTDTGLRRDIPTIFIK